MHYPDLLLKNLTRHRNRSHPGREFSLPPHGQLLEEDGMLQCHVCGAWIRGLGNHASMAHHLSAPEYRQRFGLNDDGRSFGRTALSGLPTRRRISQWQRRRWQTDTAFRHNASVRMQKQWQEFLSTER